MGGTPNGFDFTSSGGTAAINHHGRKATTLRGTSAEQFLADVERGDPQQIMARVTGNYKHGNERTAKNHSRNQGR